MWHRTTFSVVYTSVTENAARKRRRGKEPGHAEVHQRYQRNVPAMTDADKADKPQSRVQEKSWAHPMKPGKSEESHD